MSDNFSDSLLHLNAAGCKMEASKERSFLNYRSYQLMEITALRCSYLHCVCTLWIIMRDLVSLNIRRFY